MSRPRLRKRLKADSYGREGHENEHATCEACGHAGHRALTCNRPEGVALRGRSLALAEVSISLSRVPRRSTLRGARAPERTKRSAW